MANSQMDHSKMDHNMNNTTDMTSKDHSGMDHSNHGDVNSNHGDVTTHEMAMQMYFYFSSHATILFKEWKTTNWQEMLASCIGIFVVAALYEGLKVFREHLLRKHSAGINYQSSSQESTLMNPPTTTVRSSSDLNYRKRMLSLAHLLQSILHIIQVVISYFLMLIFMTYNLWLCFAVALGAGAGFFLFGWKRALVIDVNEHCH